MPRGELYINGQDAFVAWGISMNSSALSTLMTPAPMKAWVENDNRMSHGKRVITSNARKASRDITITFNIVAKDEAAFLRNYNRFCNDVLAKGILDIITSYQPNVVYKCIYESCTQFAEYQRELGQFVLKLVEPNPQDRTAPITEEGDAL